MERGLVSDVAKVIQLWKDYATALNVGDVERWLSLWIDEGIRMVPGAPRFVGLEQIQGSLESVYQRFEFQEFTIQPDEVRILGDQAYSYGGYSARMIPKEGGEAIKVDGKFLTILTKQADGLWKVAVDCFNSNLPSKPMEAV